MLFLIFSPKTEPRNLSAQVHLFTISLCSIEVSFVDFNTFFMETLEHKKVSAIILCLVFNVYLYAFNRI
jgi:hypothetical protein